MAETALVETRADVARIGLMAWFEIARDRYGKGVVGQVLELWRHTRGRNRLKPSEYYLYHLFDDHRFTPEAKATFVGQELTLWLQKGLLKSPWPEVATDRATVRALVAAQGLRTVQPTAIYHPFREVTGAGGLRTSAALADYLRTAGRLPLFVEPVRSVSGVGAVTLLSHDAVADTLALSDGRTVAVDAFVAGLEPYVADGVLFESPAPAHPQLTAVLGERRHTVCVLVVITEEGPQVFRAALRIQVGSQPTDHFWRSGNLLAGVDPETGALGRVVQGEAKHYDPIYQHPETEAGFADVAIPGWDSVRASVLRVAAAIPDCRVQSWEVVIESDGHRIRELDALGGHPLLYQLPADEGLMTGAYAALVAWAETHAADAAGAARGQSARRLKASYDEAFATEPTEADPR